MTAQCALYMGALNIFGTPDYAHGYSQHFSWAFVPIDPVNVPTKLEVRSLALPIPEIIGGTQKFGQSMDTPTLHFFQNF